MKKMLTTLLTLMVFLTLLSGADGLYKIYDTDKRTQSVVGNRLVIKIPVKRIEIRHVVLRPDTEKENVYWLECHMDRFLDPQGECLFIVDGKEIDGFTVRASKLVPKGSKWALQFSKAEVGRKWMNKIAKIYRLKAKLIEDRTKS